jgi:ubiquinone biosynthesis accessory factor UbiJ
LIVYVPSALLTSFEKAANAALRLDPDTLGCLGTLSGKCIAVEFRGLDLQIYIEPTPEGILLKNSSDLPPDTTLIGSPVAMLQMAAAPADSRLLFTGEIQIQGDIELGRRIKSLLQGLDVDWEELLSRYIGDLLAHAAGNSIRHLTAWGQQAVQTLGYDLAEYLREEAELLPDRGEIAAYLDGVDYLRADLERLDARVQRLRQQL